MSYCESRVDPEPLQFDLDLEGELPTVSPAFDSEMVDQSKKEIELDIVAAVHLHDQPLFPDSGTTIPD